MAVLIPLFIVGAGGGGFNMIAMLPFTFCLLNLGAQGIIAMKIQADKSTATELSTPHRLSRPS